jgi:hypothetical protein
MNSLRSFMEKQEKDRLRLIEEYGDDFEKYGGHNFGFNNAEIGAINKWVESLRPEILAIQNKGGLKKEFGDTMSEPYYGATGGGLTYSFTPTSLGTICVVTEAITKKSLNVQEATFWYFYG